MVNQMRDEISGKTTKYGDLSSQAEAFKCSIQDLKQQIVNQDETFKLTKEEVQQKMRFVLHKIKFSTAYVLY